MNASATLIARVVGAVVAVGMVGAGTITAAQSMVRVSHEEVQQIPRDFTHLVVQGTQADIEIREVTGAEAPSVRSWVQGRAIADSAQIDWDRDVLTVTDPCGHGTSFMKGWNFCASSITIKVPEGTRVEVESDVGSVRLTGLQGPVRAELEVGDLTADSVAGPLELSLDVGDAKVLNSRSTRVDVSAAVGDVSIQSAVAPTNLIVRSDIGSVSVALPTDGFTYHVDTSAEGPGTGSGLGSHTVSVPVDATSPYVVDVRASIGDVNIHPLE